MQLCGPGLCQQWCRKRKSVKKTKETSQVCEFCESYILVKTKGDTGNHSPLKTEIHKNLTVKKDFSSFYISLWHRSLWSCVMNSYHLIDWALKGYRQTRSKLNFDHRGKDIKSKWSATPKVSLLLGCEVLCSLHGNTVDQTVANNAAVYHVQKVWD